MRGGAGEGGSRLLSEARSALGARLRPRSPEPPSLARHGRTHPEDEVEEDEDGLRGGDAALPHGAAEPRPGPAPRPLSAAARDRPAARAA